MKTSSIHSLVYLFFLLFASNTINAQETKKEIAIKSSVICEMCKKNVEKALLFKGIEKTTVDLPAKIITVSYDPQQTNPEKIRSAIAGAGYDADDVKANPRAYKKLAKCCKK